MRSRSTLTSALSLALPRTVIDPDQTLKVGLLAPLSGKMKSWGEPGYQGCRIWQDWVNEQGGIRIGDRRYRVEVLAHDTQFNADKALAGARKWLSEQMEQHFFGGGAEMPQGFVPPNP